MKLDTVDEQFIREKLPLVEGWLLDDSAYFTSALIRWQSMIGVKGGIFEIGVYAGKYVSLFYHLTIGTGDRVVGLDTFQWYPAKKVEENIKNLFGESDRLFLMTGDSAKISEAEIMKHACGKPRFISVDGAHTSDAVLNDLKICEEILADGGVVAIDDIFNHRAIGVSEGSYRYFLQSEKPGLVPFAYCANKLFVSHAGDVARFHELAWQFTRINKGLKIVGDFNKLRENGLDWVEQKLLGYPVVILGPDH